MSGNIARMPGGNRPSGDLLARPADDNIPRRCCVQGVDITIPASIECDRENGHNITDWSIEVCDLGSGSFVDIVYYGVAANFGFALYSHSLITELPALFATKGGSRIEPWFLNPASQFCLTRDFEFHKRISAVGPMAFVAHRRPGVGVPETHIVFSDCVSAKQMRPTIDPAEKDGMVFAMNSTVGSRSGAKFCDEGPYGAGSFGDSAVEEFFPNETFPIARIKNQTGRVLSLRFTGTWPVGTGKVALPMRITVFAVRGAGVKVHWKRPAIALNTRSCKTRDLDEAFEIEIPADDVIVEIQFGRDGRFPLPAISVTLEEAKWK